jgi:transcriptional regulator with XRE-family HTH domain
MKIIFSQRLREIRHAKGVSMAQLAEKVGLIKQTISDFEHGRSNPSYVVLEKMADFFGCPVDFLMGRENFSFEVKQESPKWLADLMPDLLSLNKAGQKAVEALVRGLNNK